MNEDASYLRYPTIRGDQVAFVAEDDVWLAERSGGRAWRLTADRRPVANTRLSPDGAWVAFVSYRDGEPEVYLVAVDGGPVRRLTYWGDARTRVIGWTADNRVLATSAAGEPFDSRTWAHAVPLDGGPPERLPFGPVTGIAYGPGGSTVLGVQQRPRSAAAWKRYRGGDAGALWIDRDGTGQFVRFLADLDGQLEDPGWMGDRVVFLSDHEGWGNVYSCRADGTDLRRHTDHGDAYARAAHTDGDRLVYQCLGELWLLDDLSASSTPRRLDIRLAGPRTAREPYLLDPDDAIGEVAPDHTGRASAVEIRGRVHWLTHRDGPTRALADHPGVRARLPRVLGAGEPARVAWVSDADGEDGIEVGTVGDPQSPRRLASGQLGRVLELAASPDGRLLAAASHDGRVLLVDVASGEIRTVDSGDHGDASGLVFSPDSRWLAWSHPGPRPLRQIRLVRVDQPDATPVDATTLRFTDTCPVFTPDGKHLAFLSARTFDPAYDEHVFDMSFPAAIRPYLLPLAASTPSPFDPEVDGRPAPQPDQSGDTSGRPAEDRSGPSTDEQSGTPAGPPQVVVDVDGLDQRAVPVPVPAGRYFDLCAVHGGLLWLRLPLGIGVLGTARAGSSAAKPRPRLERYDLRKRRVLKLADGVDDIAVTGDGRSVVLVDSSQLRLVPADRAVDSSDDDNESSVDIDVRRLRVRVDPPAEWRQMFDEAGRLMRDHFWTADMAGVDWSGVLDRYRPVLDRIATRDDLSELFWEVQGELGTSHAYESPPARPTERSRQLGHLGADLVRDAAGAWRIARIVPGEPSAPEARSPLLAPGVAVQPGDQIVAVDGRPVDPTRGPAALLVGAAGVPVELTIRSASADRPEGDPAGADAAGNGAPAAGGERRVAVEPLADEMPLRYHAWVADRRAAVHAASDGRVGYLHVPDMMAEGWAQLHRDLHLEVAREALIVDVRDNRGGHVSSLVLEKLARTVLGGDVVRHGSPETYPENAPRGPLVAIANNRAGSDGDIITAAFQQLGLGPVVGTRTWGGVIGIDGRYRLVDGTSVTQPRYSFWFTEVGWAVENHGVDPDVEVPIAPQDWAAGADPQLDTAVRLALEALAARPAVSPPDPATRPSRTPPVLPPRG